MQRTITPLSLPKPGIGVASKPRFSAIHTSMVLELMLVLYFLHL